MDRKVIKTQDQPQGTCTYSFTWQKTSNRCACMLKTNKIYLIITWESFNILMCPPLFPLPPSTKKLQSPILEILTFWRLDKIKWRSTNCLIKFSLSKANWIFQSRWCSVQLSSKLLARGTTCCVDHFSWLGLNITQVTLSCDSYHKMFLSNQCGKIH